MFCIISDYVQPMDNILDASIYISMSLCSIFNSGYHFCEWGFIVVIYTHHDKGEATRTQSNAPVPLHESIVS